MRVIRILIVLLCIFAILVGIYKIYEIYTVYEEAADVYRQLEEEAVYPTEDKLEFEEPTAPEEEAPEPTVRAINFDSLLEINPKTVGWIQLEDSAINYPVAQADDNSFYLSHLWNGEYNVSGCIFLDATNEASFSDRNSVLYGHNMKNGTMFAELSKFKDQAYYDAHAIIRLYTPERDYVVKLFSGYISSGWGNAWRTSFLDEAEFTQWLDDQKARSLFQSDVVPSVHDRILTLSTCTYEYDDARFVVMGILIPE